MAIAKRGGFHTILIDQGSWCRSTGHFEVNQANFPDGLEGLVRTVRRFKDAGFRVGFHFLAASIYPPDAYLTPVPDPRLVKGATAKLAADVDPQADFIPTTAAPDAFPAEDGGYTGDGTVLQIGDELIQYAERSLQAPFGFKGCRRGHLGTHAAAHRSADAVAHLVRSYGYHMFDMDTTLLDEVSTNFARVANACEIDMLYFDGSERLQGDHWYYNARLHKAYYDKLKNKDVLLQASSFSHYSWHLLARTASADGHGDLKGLLGRAVALVPVVRPLRHAAGHRLVLRLRPECDGGYVRVRARRYRGVRRLDVFSSFGRRRPEASLHGRHPGHDPPLRTAAVIRPRGFRNEGAAADRPAVGRREDAGGAGEVAGFAPRLSPAGRGRQGSVPARRLFALARNHDR